MGPNPPHAGSLTAPPSPPTAAGTYTTNSENNANSDFKCCDSAHCGAQRSRHQQTSSVKQPARCRQSCSCLRQRCTGCRQLSAYSGKSSQPRPCQLARRASICDSERERGARSHHLGGDHRENCEGCKSFSYPLNTHLIS